MEIIRRMMEGHLPKGITKIDSYYFVTFIVFNNLTMLKALEVVIL